MYITVMTSNDNDMDFDDLQNNAWGNATNTLEEVQNHEKEDELMELLDELYPDGVDETELNDFLAYEDDYIFQNLDIDLGGLE